MSLDRNYIQDSGFYSDDPEQIFQRDHIIPLPVIDKTCECDVDFQLRCHALHGRIQKSDFPSEFLKPLETIFLYLMPGALMGSQFAVDATDLVLVNNAYRLLKKLPSSRLCPSDLRTFESMMANTSRKFVVSSRVLDSILEG